MTTTAAKKLKRIREFIESECIGLLPEEHESIMEELYWDAKGFLDDAENDRCEYRRELRERGGR